MKTAMSLEDQIKRLHEELDVAIAAYVDEQAAAVPGVHRGSVESAILARAGGCLCEEFRLVKSRITAAEELARKQQAEYALPEG
jgi:hypothetical protein